MVNNKEDCGCGSPANLSSSDQLEVLAAPCTQCTGPTLFLTNDHYCINIERDITIGQNTFHQSLYYGIGLLSVLPGPGPNQTMVTYQLCFCEANPNANAAGISHITFELCPGGAIPVQAFVGIQEADVVVGDPQFFQFPSFKLQGDVVFPPVGTCTTVTLIYDEVFTAQDLSNLRFGIKIGGGNDPEITTGLATGLPIFCSTNEPPPPTNCEEKDIFVKACVSADITVTGSVHVGTVEVHCLDQVKLGGCPGTPGPSMFKVHQELCLKIPISFSAKAEKHNETVTIGQPTETSCIPPDNGG